MVCEAREERVGGKRGLGREGWREERAVQKRGLSGGVGRRILTQEKWEWMELGGIR